MLDLLLTPLSAMSISPVRNSMNSSKAASSPSDLDARKVSFPELRFAHPRAIKTRT